MNLRESMRIIWKHIDKLKDDMNCEYGMNGCYGEECVIEVVQEVASMIEWQEQEEGYISLMTH